MPSLSPRQAVKMFAVSRTTLMKALDNGKLSGQKDDAGRWQIDAAELRRVYQARSAHNVKAERPSSDHVDQTEPGHRPPVDSDVIARLARAEAALDAEREKNAILERHLDDLRRMLPGPGERKRQGWWPWRR